MKDPFNVVVTGVGGQGNVLASLLLGAVFVELGYMVTIGETYGASQRGGSVMSHVRISRSRQYGPLMPPRSADLVIALEPSEAVRVLATYGNRQTVSVVNTRPVCPVDVIAGDSQYPDIDILIDAVSALSRKAYFLNATERALQLGNPVLSNVVLLGAVAGAGQLPITAAGLEKAVATYLGPGKCDINKTAFLSGWDMVHGDMDGA